MIARRRAELEALVDDVAPAGWRDDRRWQLLLTVAAVREAWTGVRPRALAIGIEPHADTFVGSPGPGPTELAGWIGWAIAAGHAVTGALAARDGQFEAQPLKVRIARGHGDRRVERADDVTTVAFAVGAGVVVATLDPRGPGFEQPLARRLAEHALTGGATVAVPAPGPGPLPAGPPIAVVSIGDEPVAVAHHGHRRGWTADGGPWLGVARAEGLTVLSACRLAVDGFGHAHLAGDVAGAIDRSAARALAAVAAGVVGDAAPPPLAPVVGDTVPLGVAWRRLPAATPKIARQVWTLGRVLAARPGGGVRRRGTTLQVPVAAGTLDDPTRFARRSRVALATVRFSDTVPEPYDGFAERLRQTFVLEALGHGVVGRLLAALDHTPVRRATARGGLAGAHPARGAIEGGPDEVLAGDGRVALLRAGGLPPL
ncbi:MAG TPA: hypothetical protein VHE35_10800, partial [Kofleriaceae bacterium]|nr:hypothetical protein [Kofleriaceae bacterium]